MQFRANVMGKMSYFLLLKDFLIVASFLTHFIPGSTNENIVGIPKLQKVTNGTEVRNCWKQKCGYEMTVTNEHDVGGEC